MATNIDMEPKTAWDIPQKTKNNIKKDAEIEFLKTILPIKPNTRMEICFLWDGHYRVKYWGERIINFKKNTSDTCIMYSTFIHVEYEKGAYKVIDKDTVHSDYVNTIYRFKE